MYSLSLEQLYSCATLWTARQQKKTKPATGGYSGQDRQTEKQLEHTGVELEIRF